MPVLKPKKGEGRHTFVTRFMNDQAMKIEYEDIKQRNETAYLIWEQYKKKKKGKIK